MGRASRRKAAARGGRTSLLPAGVLAGEATEDFIRAHRGGCPPACGAAQHGVMLPPPLTAPVLGRVRLVFTKIGDLARIYEAIETASPEAQAEMARWDPAGQGYTAETVCYDIANLVSRAFDQARRRPGGPPKISGFESVAFELLVGDLEFRLAAVQERRGELIGLTILSSKPAERDELSDFIVNQIKAGTPVLTWDGEGRLRNLSDLGPSFAERLI
jgi:hypothetical protein